MLKIGDAENVLSQVFITFWMLISVNVIIYRPVPLQTYQNSSHYIMMTSINLRSNIQNKTIKRYRAAAAILGDGFFVAFLIGYALKKVIKISTVIFNCPYVDQHIFYIIRQTSLTRINSSRYQKLRLQHFQMQLLYRLQVLVTVRAIHIAASQTMRSYSSLFDGASTNSRTFD